jgi:FtsP/CotA-like multicopper oxidase with cupredoxin domain
MKLTRIALILNGLLLLSSFTTINAIPTLIERQEDGKNGQDFNTDLLKSFRPLDPTPEPVIRDYVLTLSRAQLAPDGFMRNVWTSNGQYPGPMIRANKGDRIVVYVINNLEDNTTIHWHGIFQHGTTYYDGVAGQVSCDNQ